MGVGDRPGWDFFVSCATEDQKWAEWVAWTLEREGSRVLVQAWDAVPGANWVELIHSGVRDGGAILPIVSPAYLASPGGTAEWQAVLAADPLGENRRLVPILISDTDQRSLGLLATRTWIDLRGLSAENDGERARDLLLAGVTAARTGRAVPGRPVMFPGSVQAESLSAAARVRPSWDALPPLPAHFVPREAELGAVRQRLLSSVGQAVGVVGMGGAGKSTLAKALVHDPSVRQAFPDGIVWIEVKPDPDLTRLLSEVLTAFGDGAVLDTAVGTRRLRELLTGARCLLVLDDVWDSQVLDAVRVPAGVGLLVTTRTRGALYLDSQPYLLGPPSTARLMLAEYAGCPPESMPAAADVVMERCGRLPLALALAGSLVANGWSWTSVAAALEGSDLDALAGRLEDGYQYRSVRAALDASIRMLAAGDDERFRELAIFEGRKAVPIDVVALLWQATAGLDDDQAQVSVLRFAALSLVRIDRENRAIVIHDLLFDYARTTLPTGRSAALHDLLATALVNRWGGLAEGLPGLRSPDTSGAVDDYAITMLVAHLLDADRRDVLDKLLAAQRPTASGRMENIWYAAHVDRDQTQDYLATIRTVRRDAHELFTGHVDGTDDGIARQATCALITSSIVSMAGNIPPVLLVRLVVEGVWPVGRALAYARSSPHPHARAEAMSALAPHLPAEQRGDVLAHALRAATTPDRWPGDWIQPLMELYPLLPAELRAPALRAAAGIRPPESLVRTMTDLMSLLPSDQRDEARDFTLTVTAGIENPAARAEALIALVPLLPPGERPAMLDEAVMAATAIGGPGDRAAAFTALMPQLLPSQRDQVLGMALAAAAATDRPIDRVRTSTALVPFLPARERLTALRRGLRAASSLDDPAERAEALTMLVPRLPAPLRLTTVRQALRAAAAISWAHDRASAFAALLPLVPAVARHATLRHALLATAEIDRGNHRAPILASLVPYLSVDLHGLALGVAATCREDHDQVAAFAMLAPAVSTKDLHRAAGEALARALALDRAQERAVGVGGLAPFLPPAQRDTALVIALEAAAMISGGPRRGYAVATFAAHLPDHLLSEALSVAVGAEDVSDRTVSLAELVPHLPVDMLESALDAAGTIDQPAERAGRLTWLAPLVPPAERTVALDAARQAVAAVVDPHVRSGLLAVLAPHLPVEIRGALLAETLRSLRELVSSSPFAVADAMSALAPHLDIDLLHLALDAAMAIDDVLARAEALTALAPYSPPARRDAALNQALRDASAVDYPDARVLALTRLVPLLAGDRRTAAIDLAHESSGTTEEQGLSMRTLTTLLPLLSPERRAAIVSQALDAAAVDSYVDRGQRALIYLAPFASASQRDTALRRALDIALALDGFGEASIALTVLGAT